MSLFVLFSREHKLVERAKALKVNAGTEPDADLGPVISKQVRSSGILHLFLYLLHRFWQHYFQQFAMHYQLKL